MDSIRIIGLGAGGHAKLVIDTIQSTGKYDIVGLLDPDPKLWNAKVLGIDVLGGDDRLLESYAEGIRHAFVGIGSVGDTSLRRRVHEKIVEMGFTPVSAVHTGAQTAPSALIGLGTFVMAGAVVGPDARLGKNVSVNSGAIIEHDCTVGDHVQLSTGAKLAGNVSVEAGAHIGIGASVKEGISIGERAVVGGGAMVVRDVAPGKTVVGVPAK